MSEPFNPYVDWLGLQLHELPPDHYRILGLNRFANDPAAIVKAADQRMRQIRMHQTGPRGKFTQSLLNELASAKLCLLNPESKAAYDAELKSQLAAGGSGPPLPPPTPPPLPAGMTVDQAESISNVAELREAMARVATQSKATSQPTTESRSPGRWLVVPVVVLLVIAAIGGGVWAGMNYLKEPTETTTDGELTDGETVPTTDDGSDPVEPPPPETVVVGQEGDGGFQFPMPVAELQGDLTLANQNGSEVISGWNGKETSAQWTAKVVRAGIFAVHLEYWAPPEAQDAEIEITVADNSPKMRSVSLSKEGNTSKDEFPTVMKKKGEQKIMLRIFGNGADKIQLRSVKLSFRQ